MNTQILTFVLLAIAISFIGIQAYQLNLHKNLMTGNAIVNSGSNSGAIDMTGWTENEIMNYEMHGTIPAKAQARGAAPASSTGMVGGC